MTKIQYKYLQIFKGKEGNDQAFFLDYHFF